jgi:FlaA1/EpsC-like NDP-sugar epimerase
MTNPRPTSKRSSFSLARLRARAAERLRLALAPRRGDPRKIRPADLLNRRVISLDNEGIARSIEGKVILVTGAGGTIGGELSRQIVRYRPKKVVLLENHATALFYREAEVREKAAGVEISAALGDMRDQKLLDRIFREDRPQVVFHAAAHKHVHQLESNIHEGVSNNLLATYHLARAADRYGVETFLLISTDKAVRPRCVMGATKRAAEIVLSNMSRASKTRFVAVRFGNVLGSSGSVLKIFQEQIEKGQPITLTHPDAARYFMTVEEAVGLVLQTSVLAKGGEIFMLKMGEPVRIMDLARSLIRLSGLEPDRDIEIRVTGLKPGEKITEELIEDVSGAEQSAHPDIMVLRSENGRVESLADAIMGLELMSLGSGKSEMIRALAKLVPTYTADPVHDEPSAEPDAGAAPARAESAGTEYLEGATWTN